MASILRLIWMRMPRIFKSRKMREKPENEKKLKMLLHVLERNLR